MNNEYMKRCSTSLVVRETNKKYKLPLHILWVQKSWGESAGEDAVKPKHLYTASGYAVVQQFDDSSESQTQNSYVTRHFHSWVYN